MANTTILLREDVDHVGGRGDLVKVKAGYARNFLLPQGLATLATKGNVKQIEQEREALLKKAAVERSTAEAQREQMSGLTLSFARKAGENGTLFGSVTSMDIAEGLKEKGYEIDRRRIQLKDVVKVTGEYSVTVKLHREVPIEIPFTVTDEDGNIAERAETVIPEAIDAATEPQPDAAPAAAESDDPVPASDEKPTE